MPAPTPTPQSPAEPNWRAAITPYVTPDMRRALVQLATTALPFILIMAAMLVALHYGILAALLLFPAAAMLLVRLFMFQHDCGHGSFFKARWANDLLGWVLGVLTLTRIWPGAASTPSTMPAPAIWTGAGSATSPPSRSPNIWRCPGAGASPTGSTATHWSCSASGRSGCF